VAEEAVLRNFSPPKFPANREKYREFREFSMKIPSSFSVSISFNGVCLTNGPKHNREFLEGIREFNLPVNGFVLLPHTAPWLSDYVAELTGFPGTKFDDQVDSTTQALLFLKILSPLEVFLRAYA
jgi:hypothetical protein